MPAAIKNAVDVGSRPYGKSVWSGKPGAIISASPSMLGAYGASQHMRQSLTCLNIYCMPNPETYLSQADKLFDPRSEEHTSELQSLMRISYAVFCLKKTQILTTFNNSHNIYIILY